MVTEASPTLAPTPTREEVIRNEQRVAALTNDIVSRLSLQPPESPVHNVEVHGTGLRIPLSVFPDKVYYIYALPWSRGWSVFTSPYPNEGAHSWRTVPQNLKGLQKPLYGPRSTVGAWHVGAEAIVDGILHITSTLQKLDRAKRKRFDKKHWYWPASAYANRYTPAQTKDS